MSIEPPPDRLARLLSGGDDLRFNGIDYVEIASSDQTRLGVHFLNTVAVKGTLSPGVAVTITGGETIASVPVLPFDESSAWSADADGRPILNLWVAAPGDFSTYTLTIASSALDPYFAAVPFTFKANCPSDVDSGDSSRAPAARRRAGADQLPGQGFRRLHASAV